nr:hypothetical protein [Tanacetum cinerariifolium]
GGESGGCDVVVAAEEWIRRVIASGVRDRVDRLMESVFGLGRKNPPENFPAGGGVVAGWKWAAGGGEFEEILIGQEPFQFSPGDLIGLLYSNRFGIGIPLGQGILDESISSKFHFAILGTVAMRKYRFSSFKPMNKTNSSFRTIEVERLAAHKLIRLWWWLSRSHNGDDGGGFGREMVKVMRWCEDGSGGCLEISSKKMSSERKGAPENIYNVTFCWLPPIPAGDLVSAGHMLFLLVMYFSCWYALTANPTIYASMVRQFWGSASEVSLPNGVKGLVATIDGTVYTVTEASIRSAL